MKQKKIIAIVMALIVFFNVPIVAETPRNNVSSFIDSEGKINTVKIEIIKAGHVKVEYYLEGTLINVVETSLANPNSFLNGQNLDFDNEKINIVVNDVKSNKVIKFDEHISKYISSRTYPENLFDMPFYNNSFVYQGKIKYNLYYDSLGNPQQDSLLIYKKEKGTEYKYKTINAEQGNLVSVIISVIAAILSVYYGPLGTLAEELLVAAAYAAGVSIIAGVIQGSISKQYYVKETLYDVKAWDIKTSRENIYNAQRYQVLLEGGSYSSTYYYEGYLPWNNHVVAYWIFNDFWAYSYPGVESYL